MKEIIGFGIAGNFALHLEQAGEADDFALVKTDDEYAPKGIFPFYVNGLLMGVLDVDSEFLSSFNEIDEKYLKEILSLLD